MKVKELLKELSEHPERREELLGSAIFEVMLITAGGYKEFGYGFDDLVRIGAEVYEGRVSKERWLFMIEHDLMLMDGDVEVGFRVVLRDPRIETPKKFEISELKMPEMIEVVDVEYEKEPPPPYRSKMKPFDKRRNFKPKNFWNRIRSRCK